MTPSRKTPGMAFWATVVVVVVLFYFMSFGPYLWFHNRFSEPEWMDRATDVYFAPADWAAHHLGAASDLYGDYLWLWIRAGKNH